MNAWIAFAGIVATLAGALMAVWLTQRAENQRFYTQQVYSANVARADRLRGIYGQMAQASISLRLVISQRAFLFEGETEQERNQRHDDRIKEALGMVGEVGGLILVESSAVEIRDAYSAVALATDRYMDAELHEPNGGERQDKLINLANEVTSKTDEVLRLCQDHLATLETPVPVESGRSRRGGLLPMSRCAAKEGIR